MITTKEILRLGHFVISRMIDSEWSKHEINFYWWGDLVLTIGSRAFIAMLILPHHTIFIFHRKPRTGRISIRRNRNPYPTHHPGSFE